MRLLFDENLAARLAADLVDLFPGSSSVSALAMGGATDREIWATAAIEGFALVTKDEDFQRLSVAEGHPPKVIWIRLGNCTTAAVARLLRSRHAEVVEFLKRPDAAFLALG